jgi:hypothetical protein
MAIHSSRVYTATNPVQARSLNKLAGQNQIVFLLMNRSRH